MTATPWDTARLEQLDPRTLLLDRNSRTIIDLEAEDPDLVASVQRHGVKVPVLAARVDDDRVRVLDGHSRTIAATLAVDEHPTIPVLLVDVGDEQDWELLRDQWIANEVRRGYSPADKARIMQELTLFGLSAQDVADQLSTTTELVDAGLAVQASAKATELTVRHPQLDVLQLAAVAEFENDDEACATLETTLAEEPEQFDHVVSQLRRQRALRAERDARAAELRAAGVTVLDEVDASTTLPLSRLLSGDECRARLDRQVDDHATCPGHVVTVSACYGQVNVQYHCRDWKSHGHIDAWSSSTPATARGQLSETEKAERRRVRANNEAWRAAQEVRRRWLRTHLFAAKKPPKRAQQYLLMALALGGGYLTHALSSGNRYACRLLGLPEPKPGQRHPMTGRAKRATAEQALMMAIAVLVGACEGAMDAASSVDTWRHPSPEDRLYFAALQDWGYVLSKVERLVLDADADEADWPHLAAQPAADIAA